MKREALTHWKFDALRETLGLARYEAVGILETLWWWTAEHRDDGRLTGITASGLAAVIGWKGDAEALVGALLGAGWLDDDGCLIVHDWHDHCPKYVYDRRQKRGKRTNAERARAARTASDSGVSPTFADNRRQSPKIDTRLGKARLGETESASHSHAREESEPTAADPVAATVAEMQQVAGDVGARWTRGTKQAAAATVRALGSDGHGPAVVLAAWGRYCADDFWRPKGLPLDKFREHFPRFAAAPAAPKASADEKRRALGRPSSDWRVCECGHPAARYHDGGRCKATSCGCEAFRESAEEVTA